MISVKWWSKGSEISAGLCVCIYILVGSEYTVSELHSVVFCVCSLFRIWCVF